MSLIRYQHSLYNLIPLQRITENCIIQYVSNDVHISTITIHRFNEPPIDREVVIPDTKIDKDIYGYTDEFEKSEF